MIPENFKDSLAILEQFPQFVRNDSEYQTFISFVEAYYQWMETEKNVLDRSKNLLNYKDIDATLDEFEEYFFNEFLPGFPKESLTNKRELVKFSRELYQRKSTISSYKFLFRALYNSDVEIYNGHEFVLKSSSGKWVLPKSVLLKTLNDKFLKTKNLKLFGTESKSVSKIETSQVANNSIEIFLSDSYSNFYSGELVKVVDDNLNDIEIDGEFLEAKIIGTIKTITVDPKYIGKDYKPQDPVILYEGIDYESNEIEASAEVSEVYNGELKGFQLKNPSTGFRTYQYSYVDLSNGNGSGGAATVSDLNYTKEAKATYISKDIIDLHKNQTIGAINYNFSSNLFANKDTKIVDTLKFHEFFTYPLKTIEVLSIGNEYTTSFDTNVYSLYDTEVEQKSNLSDLGILGPIEVVSPGKNYKIGDEISFSGGFGFGAKAIISQVSGTGQIIATEYIYDESDIVNLGGFGYSVTDLPKLTVNSTEGQNAELRVVNILGDGEKVAGNGYPKGSIKSISVLNSGEDYRSSPKVSLRIIDVVISGVSVLDIPKKTSIIYQKDYYKSSFIGIIDSITRIPTEIPNYYIARIFDFNGSIDIDSTLYLDKNTFNDKFYKFTVVDYDINGFTNGLKYYGNGLAKATANFVSGINTGKGEFLGASGNLSSYQKLEGLIYNKYSYFLQVEKAFKSYKEMLYNVIHPAGTRIIGQNVIKNKANLARRTSKGFVDYRRNYLPRTLHNPSLKISMDVKPSLYINVDEGGQGFRVVPNSEIALFNNDGKSSANVTAIDSSNLINTNLVVRDIIGVHGNELIGNTTLNFVENYSANANVELLSVFSFDSIFTGPIANVEFITPKAYSTTLIPDVKSVFKNETQDYSLLTPLGILGDIEIINGGLNYQVNDTISFIGGDGFGAYANVSSVDANGKITSINYVTDPTGEFIFNLGGIGYTTENLPKLSINSLSGSSAELTIKSILGDGEKLSIKQEFVNFSTNTVNVENLVDYKKHNPTIKFDIDIESSSILPTKVIDDSLVRIPSTGFRIGNTSVELFSNAGIGGELEVSEVDLTKPFLTTYIVKDVIDFHKDIVIGSNSYNFAANTSDANSSLTAALSFDFFNSYPLKDFAIISSGENYENLFDLDVVSTNNTEVEGNKLDLKILGILGDIEIINGGLNYQVNDTISFIGGDGFGAYANVSSVDANGKITSINYIYGELLTSLGGLGYANDNLPLLVVNSSTGSSANVIVKSIIADGEETFGISTIKFTENVTSINANSASVKVGDPEKDSIQVYDFDVDYGGQGFLVSELREEAFSDISPELKYYGNSAITFTGSYRSNSAFGEIYDVDETKPWLTSLISTDVISFKADIRIDEVAYNFANNAIANLNSTLKETLTFKDYYTYPILKIRGENLNDLATLITAHSLYDAEYYQRELSSLGILGPIEIVSGGKNYLPYEKVTFEGGFGCFASAHISNVNEYGAIVGVEFDYDNENLTSLGGFGYTNDNLPTLSVDAMFGSGAILKVNHVLGSGEKISGKRRTKTNGLPLSYTLSDKNKLVINQDNFDGRANTEKVFSTISFVDDANNIVKLNDCTALYFANVATGYTLTSNSIYIDELTGNYDLINNGTYQSVNRLKDIAFVNDYIGISNNTYVQIESINYDKGIIFTSNTINASGNSKNTQLISIAKNLTSNNVIFEYELQYNELYTEDDLIIIDENDDIIEFTFHSKIEA